MEAAWASKLILEEKGSNAEGGQVDFSLGQTFFHNDDAAWIGKSAGEIVGFCVVDGVGGYRARGIDSGVMARLFSESVRRTFTSSSNTSQALSAERVLMNAWNYVRQKKAEGGITLISGFLDVKQNHLKICQVGDCVTLVLRPDTHARRFHTAFETPGHEKGFNQPIMLSHDCPKVELALSHFVQLSPGDIILISSDGFVDNYDISTLLHEFDFLSKSCAESIQRKLLSDATQNSLSNKPSPFSKKAQSYKLNVADGGKRDDISLIAIKM